MIFDMAHTSHCLASNSSTRENPICQILRPEPGLDHTPMGLFTIYLDTKGRGACKIFIDLIFVL